ncbi:DNA/RNA non-specific endonuclease [Ekhidna sp.]|uniref:DNA/RNA non-specific endonuclease n=1 Tax=Ekhidna sp. TaxID=2608089 RepID=UPI003296BA09
MRTLSVLLTIAISLFTCKAQEHLVPLFTYGGLPQGSDIQILYNQAFITGYSNEKKSPLWVCYRLGNVQGSYDDADNTIIKWERPYSFQVDNRTSAKVTHDDYTSSGYDRGHLAPNAAMLAQYGQLAQLETYLMSNIIPQHRDLNRGIWASLEGYARKILSQDDTDDKEINDLYVITGPIFIEDLGSIGNGVIIPSHSYKIFAYKKGYFGTVKAVAFVMPQHPQSDNFLDYVKSVDEVEELTGLNFFSELSEVKQKNLEIVKRNFELEEIN